MKVKSYFEYMDRTIKFSKRLQARNTEAARELRAERKTRTLARREANARAEEVKDGEDDRRDRRDDHDLLNIGDLARDDYHRNRDGEALKEILNRAHEEFRSTETVHLLILRTPKIFSAPLAFLGFCLGA